MTWRGLHVTSIEPDPGAAPACGADVRAETSESTPCSFSMSVEFGVEEMHSPTSVHVRCAFSPAWNCGFASMQSPSHHKHLSKKSVFERTFQWLAPEST